MMETILSSLSARLSLSTADRNLEMVMPKGSVWRIEGNPSGVTVACVSGMVWLTQEGDYEDHVLGSAERFALNRAGRTLVMALEDSRICVMRVPVVAEKAMVTG